MENIDVVAVVGSCAPERRAYAEAFAGESGRMLIPAGRLSIVPDPVEEAASLALWGDAAAGVVAEFPAHTPMTELVGAFADRDARTTLSSIVCVVDAAHLLVDLGRDSYATHPVFSQFIGRHVAHAMLTVSQIEFASTVVLVGWEPVPTDELATIMAVVSALAPTARLRLDQRTPGIPSASAPYREEQERPGWVALLNGEHDPHMTDGRVSAFRYENLRPLHPGRLRELLDGRIEPGEFGTVLRSAGFCRFATRPRAVARWEHVGRMVSFDRIGRDDALEDGEEQLAIGQELGIIGLDLDLPRLIAALDKAALSDAELSEGPEVWAEYPDPFPAWPAVPDRAD